MSSTKELLILTSEWALGSGRFGVRLVGVSEALVKVV